MSLHWKGFWITLAGVVVISPDTLLLRLISADVGVVVFWRGLLSGLMILGWAAFQYRGRLFEALRALGPQGWAMALVFGVGNILFVLAVHLTSVANALFLISTSPIFAALISRVFLRERVSRRALAAIAATMVGVAIIAIGAEGGRASLAGDAAALGVALALATSFNIARQARSRSLTPAIGMAGLFSCGVAGCAALVAGGGVAVASTEIAPLLIMALVIAPVGTVLITIGPRYIPAAEVSLLMLVEAILGPLLVWAVLAEEPPEATLVGGAVILTALAGLNLARLVRPRMRS
jgi:drug/metabolite transporter (DMT)-like permease